jgi:hypothetical protein
MNKDSTTKILTEVEVEVEVEGEGKGKVSDERGQGEPREGGWELGPPKHQKELPPRNHTTYCIQSREFIASQRDFGQNIQRSAEQTTFAQINQSNRPLLWSIKFQYLSRHPLSFC